MRKYGLSLGITFGGSVGYCVWKNRDINTWKSVSEDEIIWSWLKAEMNDPKHQFADSYKKQLENAKIDLKILDNPDFQLAEHNNIRRSIFNKVRGNYSLWKPIYKNTKWYKVKMFVNGPFNHIFGPYPPKPKEYVKLNLANSKLDGIILWGHYKEGPFIILEGNHRWYARKKWLPYICEVYVGLSPAKYPLHASSGCVECI